MNMYGILYVTTVVDGKQDYFERYQITDEEFLNHTLVDNANRS